MLGPAKIAAALALLVLAVPAPAFAQAFDPAKLAASDVVEILTADADGATRTTRIWIVRVDDHAYIRTGNTHWEKNLEREPVATLRAGGVEYPVRVEFVGDEGLLARVEQAYREKYGFMDRLSAIMRPGKDRIMRLDPGPAAAPTG